jgi:uncharacterized protein YaiI (UPF0178 family)
MCLARKALPINQDGILYNNSNMDSLLNARYNAKKIRDAGGRLKGPKKRTEEQNTHFYKNFEELLINSVKNGEINNNVPVSNNSNNI